VIVAKNNTPPHQIFTATEIAAQPTAGFGAHHRHPRLSSRSDTLATNDGEKGRRTTAAPLPSPPSQLSAAKSRRPQTAELRSSASRTHTCHGRARGHARARATAEFPTSRAVMSGLPLPKLSPVRTHSQEQVSEDACCCKIQMVAEKHFFKHFTCPVRTNPPLCKISFRTTGRKQREKGESKTILTLRTALSYSPNVE